MSFMDQRGRGADDSHKVSLSKGLWGRYEKTTSRQANTRDMGEVLHSQREVNDKSNSWRCVVTTGHLKRRRPLDRAVKCR